MLQNWRTVSSRPASSGGSPIPMSNAPAAWNARAPAIRSSTAPASAGERSFNAAAHCARSAVSSTLLPPASSTKRPYSAMSINVSGAAVPN